MQTKSPIDAPPEGRQTLVTVLVAVLGYLPLARYLSWKISAFLALVVGLRLIALRWPTAMPGRYVLFALTVAGGSIWLHAYQGVPGLETGAALFATMLMLKLLELRTRRDHRILVVLIGFLAVVQLLFDRSLAIAFYMSAILLGAMIVLADLNGGLGARSWMASIRLAARMSLEALPIALALFFLFPRLEAPLWSLGSERQSAVIGMSDRLEPGAISELVIDGELAFRARFDRTPPPAERLYWRGLVLWEAGDRGWSPGLDPEAIPRDEPLEEAGDWIDYEVLLEPSKQRWMFALDLPTDHPPNTSLSGDYQLRADGPITAPMRYRMRSAQTYRTPKTPESQRRYALRLPDNVTPRMRALADSWRQSTANDSDLVEAALTYFHQEPFFYTLLPPPLGANPTDEFLFETRSGFCEHYASSFALLMRIAGIPSRIVLGYLGGEPNRIGGYTMVWQSSAHAWVEVLIEGRGWVRVDPTSAVAPGRIDNRSATRLLGAGASVRFELDGDSAFAKALRQARDLVDSLDAAWQDWVLDFNVDNQKLLLDRMGLGAYGETGLVILMTGTVGVILALTVAALLRSGRQQPDPVQSCYQEFCDRLARVGLARRDWEGPEDFGRRIQQIRPDLADQAARILTLYIDQRYGPKGSPDGARQLAKLARDFRPRRKPQIEKQQ